MIIARFLYKSNGQIYLNLIKEKIRVLVKVYNPVLKEIINQYTEEKIYKAIDTIYISNGTIFCPTNGFYGQILRALEYGTGKNKSYHIISQAVNSIKKEVGVYEPSI